jgi:transcription antitermination factor NusG
LAHRLPGPPYRAPSGAGEMARNWSGIGAGCVAGRSGGGKERMMDVDMTGGVVVTEGGVTPPGAWHPECGAHSEISPLFKPATMRGGARPGSGPKRKPASVVVSAAGPRWVCVEVARRAEGQVVDTLLRMGFDAVVPMFMDVLPANPARKLARREVLRPAFPGYVMAEIDLADVAWRAIASQRGVVRLMGSSPERPSAIPAVKAAWLLSQYGVGGVQRRSVLACADRMAPLAEGAEVVVSAGPYEGSRGVVLASDGRAVVLRIGGWRVRMAQSAVEVAGPPQD